MHKLRKNYHIDPLMGNPPCVVENRTSDGSMIQTQYNPYSPGLVFWLDGKRKNNLLGTLEWVDLIGHIVFDNYSSTIPVQFHENCVYFPSQSAMVNGTTLFQYNYTTHTIEICYDKQSTSGTMFIPQSNNNVAFGSTVAGNGLVKTGSSVKTLTFSSSGVHTVSVNFTDQLALDNVNNQLSWGGSNSWTIDSAGYSVIGMRPGQQNYPFVGKIYSIRIYDRLLTIDEMRHNQLIDIQRFKLNIPT